MKSIAVMAMLAALATPVAFAQRNDPQVLKLVQDAVRAFDAAPCEFEADISANVFDAHTTTYTKAKGYLAGQEKCHAEVSVKGTEVEWFENKGSAAAKVAGGVWQKAGLAPDPKDKVLLHWISPVQVLKELQAASAFFPERSSSGEGGKRSVVALDLSPMLPQYYQRLKLDANANDATSLPQTSATVEIDNEKKRVAQIGYTIVIAQRAKAAETGKGEWSWEDGDLKDHQGAMDTCPRTGPIPRLNGGQELVLYTYQAKFVFKYPPTTKQLPAPKEVTALLNW